MLHHTAIYAQETNWGKNVEIKLFTLSVWAAEEGLLSWVSLKPWIVGEAREAGEAGPHYYRQHHWSEILAPPTTTPTRDENTYIPHKICIY